ncbi:MAG: hypothetical protein ABH983_01980 [Candidatus Micrarchaeota archaeon]
MKFNVSIEVNLEEFFNYEAQSVFKYVVEAIKKDCVAKIKASEEYRQMLLRYQKRLLEEIENKVDNIIVPKAIKEN